MLFILPRTLVCVLVLERTCDVVVLIQGRELQA